MKPTHVPGARLVLTAIAFILTACAAVPSKEAVPQAPASRAQQRGTFAPAPSPGPGAATASPIDQGGYPGTAASPPAPAPPSRSAVEAEAPSRVGPSSAPGRAPDDALVPRMGRSALLVVAGTDLEAAQRELDRGGRDCKAACRALGSMDRAVGRLYELAGAEGEIRRCEDARLKLFSARERVRTMCGACSGGPSVEAGAPIPSLE
jgi:hypothetical protein